MALAGFIIFALAGLGLNAANSDKINTFDDVKDAIEMEIEEVKARDGFVSYKLND